MIVDFASIVFAHNRAQCSEHPKKSYPFLLLSSCPTWWLLLVHSTGINQRRDDEQESFCSTQLSLLVLSVEVFTSPEMLEVDTNVILHLSSLRRQENGLLDLAWTITQK